MFALLSALLYTNLRLGLDKTVKASANPSDYIQGIYMVYDKDDDGTQRVIVSNYMYEKSDLKESIDAGTVLFFIPYYSSNVFKLLSLTVHGIVVQHLSHYLLQKNEPSIQDLKSTRMYNADPNIPSNMYFDDYIDDSTQYSNTEDDIMQFVDTGLGVGFPKRFAHIIKIKPEMNFYRVAAGIEWIANTPFGGFVDTEYEFDWSTFNMTNSSQEYPYGKPYFNVKGVATKFGLRYEIDEPSLSIFNVGKDSKIDGGFWHALVPVVSSLKYGYGKTDEDVIDLLNEKGLYVKSSFKTLTIVFAVLFGVFLFATIALTIVLVLRLRRPSDKSIDDIEDKQHKEDNV